MNCNKSVFIDNIYEEYDDISINRLVVQYKDALFVCLEDISQEIVAKFMDKGINLKTIITDNGN